MGMLDGLNLGQAPTLAGLLNLPDGGGFPDVAKPVDEGAEAQKAREVAALRLGKRGESRQDWGAGGTSPFPAPDELAPSIQMATGALPMPSGAAFGSLAPSPYAAGPTIPAPQAAPPMPQEAPAVAPQAAPAAPPPIAPPVPMPAPRPPEAPQAPTSTDISAQSKPAAAPASDGEPAVPGSSLIGRLQKGVSDNSNLLLGLASGFAGAGSIGSGMRAGFANAIPGAQLDQKQKLFDQQQQGLPAQYRALVGAGVPPHQAVAALYNPEIMKSVVTNYLGDRKAEIKTVKSKDQFGNETERLVSVNPYDSTSKEIQTSNGQPAGGTNAALAPGVSGIDSNKRGDEYLTQFSPEVQSGVKAYLRGDSLPTGRQQLAQTIKMVAQKYGDDIGMPANDFTLSQRKAFATSLGDTKSGVGMQTKGFQQGLEHMANLSDKWVQAKQAGGFGIEPIANIENHLRGLTSSQKGIYNGIGADSSAAAGEIGKLFSGNSGGGVHERSESQKRLGDTGMSGTAAAGALEATLGLMDGGLKPLEQRRDELFPGSEKPRGSEFRGPDQQKAIERIQRNIATLRGEQSASPSAAPAPGNYVYDPKTKSFGPAQ
jgi:hypothetical protein